jgi:ferric-dicitrate binding protein FerR (iron transport regulator)
MNREDIIRMAREAGAKPSHNPEEWDILKIRDTDLERFAALVAAHERQWVGLTDEDMAELRRSGLHAISDTDFRAIEAKLKEMNGGSVDK